MERQLQEVGNGALARARQAGQPDDGDAAGHAMGVDPLCCAQRRDAPHAVHDEGEAFLRVLEGFEVRREPRQGVTGVHRPERARRGRPGKPGQL